MSILEVWILCTVHEQYIGQKLLDLLTDVAVSKAYTVNLILFIFRTCPGFLRRNSINCAADMYLFGKSWDSYMKFGNIEILKVVGSHAEP